MNSLKLTRNTLPGLYQSSDQASLKGQSLYFLGLRTYSILLLAAAFCSFLWPDTIAGAAISVTLFVITLLILIALRLNRPDDIWYNGRAVAESVKTISWRWSMRAEPFDSPDLETTLQLFTNDLKNILKQNTSLSKSLPASAGVKHSISDTMRAIRDLPVLDRLDIYKRQRIDDQASWYSTKSESNRKRARFWFWMSVILHIIAIAMLVARVAEPKLKLPIEVVATAASAALAWLESKKYNELNSSYSLAAHEISIIKDEADLVETEKDLAVFVKNSENAFSREHTQWVAKKST